MRKLCFVIPRYYSGIAGGAETLLSNLAFRAAAQGHEVTILTTCAKDNRTWENVYPEGESQEQQVCIKRFRVDARNLDVWIPLQIKLNDGLRLTLDEQLDWMSESVNSQGLYEHLHNESAHYDLIFLGPYLFGITFWASRIAPQKSILVPCLHDERAAYLEIMKDMFTSVKGCIFNAHAEKVLAERLYTHVTGMEVGMGFEVQEVSHQVGEYPIPYILYLGRKETGKNVHVLIDYFCAAKKMMSELAPLKLLIAGGGSFSDILRPDALSRNDIIDVPHLSEEKKQSLIKNALALVQPSTNESFSIVIMEAWLQSVPSLVHAHCAVTREHVIDANGGLYFSDASDLAAGLCYLLQHKEVVSTLGENGRQYVLNRYSWDAVMQRFDAACESFL